MGLNRTGVAGGRLKAHDAGNISEDMNVKSVSNFRSLFISMSRPNPLSTSIKDR